MINPSPRQTNMHPESLQHQMGAYISWYCSAKILYFEGGDTHNSNINNNGLRLILRHIPILVAFFYPAQISPRNKFTRIVYYPHVRNLLHSYMTNVVFWTEDKAVAGVCVCIYIYIYICKSSYNCFTQLSNLICDIVRYVILYYDHYIHILYICNIRLVLPKGWIPEERQQT